MNRLITFLLLLFTLSAGAQPVVFLNKDSLTRENKTSYFLKKNWRFYEGGDTAMAAVSYNDSQWLITNSDIHFNPDSKHRQDTFSSVAWFRLHIIADTSITNIPLALSITQYGASYIYLDGNILDSFGYINGADSTTYFDPQHYPFSIVLHSAGEHVIAVRYANYAARHNYNLYSHNLSGFRMHIGNADGVFYAVHEGNTSIILSLLTGIFAALAMLHCFLFLFYRHFRANIYYSIFCISLGISFFLLYLNQNTSSVGIEMKDTFVGLATTTAICISFSGFNNELFSSAKLRFRIFTALCIATCILWIADTDYGGVLFIGVVAFALLESIVLTIKAMYRKIPGARIIGTGILFFVLFVCFAIIRAIGFGDFSFDENTLSGEIMVLWIFCAILSIPISMSLYLAWHFAGINKNLASHLQQVQQLSQKTIEQEQEKQKMLATQNEKLEEEVTIRTHEISQQKEWIEKQHSDLKTEKKKSDDLLLNILPEEVAEELKEKGYSAARFFNNVTVLFTDFVDFTKAGENMHPQQLVDELHICFKAFDGIVSKYNIEKIKTIGDAYLAVSGLPVNDPAHAASMVAAALEIQQFIALRRQQHNNSFEIRMGIHSGSVVAGIVGVKKFAYDIWGDTVNTAARMEQSSMPGKINISQSTYELVKGSYRCTHRGEVAAKNKGVMSMYFIEGAL